MIDDIAPARLLLPVRPQKPRPRGRTMVIDTGLPLRAFEDLLDSHAELMDSVKFGWGTCLVTKDIKAKIDICHGAGVDAYFGGTLFEKYAARDAVDAWRDLCRSAGVTTVEISNGTVEMDAEEKAGWVALLADEFTVVSEVGFKDSDRSLALPVGEWVAAVHADLAAGASTVTLEARESGRSGIGGADGTPRADLVAAITSSGVDVDRLLFEAPTKELQLHLLRTLGPDVNLGNIRTDDVVPLETLRLGLRSDTFDLFDEIDEEP